MTEPSVRAVAEAVVELLIERGLIVAATPVPDGRVLDTAGVSRLLGRSRQWVYAHADELGAFRYGTGPRARLGFDRIEIDRWKHDRRRRLADQNGRAGRPAAPRRAPARGANLIAFDPMKEGRSIGPSDRS